MLCVKMGRFSLILLIGIISSSSIFIGKKSHVPKEADVYAVLYSWSIPRRLGFEPYEDPSIVNGSLCQIHIKETNGVENGRCLPFKKCPELQNDLNENGLTRDMIDNIRSRLCRVTTGGYMLCCKEEVMREVIPSDSSIRGGQSALLPDFFPSSTNSPSPFTTWNPQWDLNFDSIGLPCGRTVPGKGNARHPWLVSIGNVLHIGDFIPECEAMLISSRHMISAAHCFFRNSQRIPITHASFGEQSLVFDNEVNEIIRRKIQRTILHPQFNEFQADLHNIALIQIEGFVNYSANIRHICLPFPSTNVLNIIGFFEMATIGWGDTHFDNQHRILSNPIEGRVSVTSYSDCDRFYNLNRRENRGNVCALPNRNNPRCPSESGSFMTYNDADQVFLAGIMSVAPFCNSNDPKSPTIYTRVPYYTNWVRRNY